MLDSIFLFSSVFLSADVTPGGIINLDMSLIINGLIHGFNIALLILLLVKLLNNPVRKFMADRAAGIRDDIESARIDRAKAEEMKTDYQGMMDNIEKEREEILKKAHRRADEMHSQIVADAHKAAEDLKAKANSDINIERANIAEDIKKQIIEVSALVAERFILDKIDEETQNKYIDEALADWGEHKHELN